MERGFGLGRLGRRGGPATHVATTAEGAATDVATTAVTGELRKIHPHRVGMRAARQGQDKLVRLNARLRVMRSGRR